MKKVLVLLTLQLFVWAQSAVITHVYESDHLYHKAGDACQECAFLDQCSGADLPPIPLLLSFALQDFFTQEKSAQVVFQPSVFCYSSRSPPITSL